MQNKVYINPERKIMFGPTPSGWYGGPPDIGYPFQVAGLANAAGLASLKADNGAAPRAALFEWRAKSKAASVVASGNMVQLYIATSDDGLTDSNIPESGGAVTAVDTRKNLKFIGSLIVDSPTGSGTDMASSGLVRIYSRYFHLVAYNKTGVALSSASTDHLFSFKPLPDEVQ